MEVEKKRSKGGFLNLFDWNGKSRKKLFANNAEFAGVKHGKENIENSSKVSLYQVELNEKLASSGNKVTSDWNCALSETQNGIGRAPGVVARLMGLDSLPSFNFPEPCSTPFVESPLIRSSHPSRNTDFWTGHCPLEGVHAGSKKDRITSSSIDYRAQMMLNRPLEKFQSEVLPPKSAKSIPVTHHKLLSPIRSPGFIPTRNPAYVMEAAAKIIEASPNAYIKSKTSSIGPCSVPLRIRDLKEKLDAAHKVSRPDRPKEAGVSKFSKAQTSDRSHSGSEYGQGSRTSSKTEKTASDSVRNKDKSVSLAVQAKVNVQGREEGASSSNRSSVYQKEQDEIKGNQLFKSQTGVKKTLQKRTINRNSPVLRQNNQKQNSVPNKERSSAKTPTSASSQPPRRAQTHCSFGPNTIVNKVLINSETDSRNTSPSATDGGRELSSFKRKNIVQKKKPVNLDGSSDRTVVNDALSRISSRAVESNVPSDGFMNWDLETRKHSTDVVSFTFTSPLKGTANGSRFSHQAIDLENGSIMEPSGDNSRSCLRNLALSTYGLDTISGDALSVLLEQKLQELTCKVELSQSNGDRYGISGCSTSNLQDTLANASPTSGEVDERYKLELHGNESKEDCQCSSANGLVPDLNRPQELQVTKEMEELDYNRSNTVLNVEPSVENENWSDERSISNSTWNQSPAPAQDSGNIHSTDTVVSINSELSDSATSASTNRLDSWELKYVRDVLNNAELAVEDFALGIASKFITPFPFDSFEPWENGNENSGPEYSKLEQKLLFDCLNECLNLKFSNMLPRSCRAWSRQARTDQRNELLAEEVYKQMLSWKCMGELTGDELVDKDMSTLHGRWLNFDDEAVEEGLEIELGILSSLVDELVTDLVTVH